MKLKDPTYWLRCGECQHFLHRSHDELVRCHNVRCPQTGVAFSSDLKFKLAGPVEPNPKAAA